MKESHTDNCIECFFDFHILVFQAKEQLRLKYRYLDLHHNELQANLRLKSQVSEREIHMRWFLMFLLIGGLDNDWREKGLPRIGHRLAFCSLLILMFLCLQPCCLYLASLISLV